MTKICRWATGRAVGRRPERMQCQMGTKGGSYRWYDTIANLAEGKWRWTGLQYIATNDYAPGGFGSIWWKTQTITEWIMNELWHVSHATTLSNCNGQCPRSLDTTQALVCLWPCHVPKSNIHSSALSIPEGKFLRRLIRASRTVPHCKTK